MMLIGSVMSSPTVSYFRNYEKQAFGFPSAFVTSLIYMSRIYVKIIYLISYTAG